MPEPSTPAPSPSAQRAIARRDAEERAARRRQLRTVAIVVSLDDDDLAISVLWDSPTG